MKYYRCKCGKRQAWGSMGPYRCEGCEDCNTTLEMSPGLHRTPDQHSWIPTSVETDEGDKTLTRCEWCHRTKKELEEKKR